MSIVFLLDHDHHKPNSDSLKALSAARHFNKDIDIFIASDKAYEEGHPLVAMVKKIPHIRHIIYSQSSAFANFQAETISQTLFNISQDYDIFISAATSRGKAIMPRLAGLLDVMQISNIVEIIDENNFKRPIYSGSAIATVRSLDKKKVLTIQSASFKEAASAGAENCQEQTIPAKEPSVKIIEPAPDLGFTAFIDKQEASSDKIDLANAKIILGGGRGFANGENFMRLLQPLAKKLNAAIGASRAAVDAGYAPNEWQIGQTGKIVAPELYFAIGLSGAMQHIAGIKDAKIIVVINQDAKAPILEVADYALIGDLFEILPELEKAL